MLRLGAAGEFGDEGVAGAGLARDKADPSG